jgi:hypothetical protein
MVGIAETSIPRIYSKTYNNFPAGKIIIKYFSTIPPKKYKVSILNIRCPQSACSKA